MSFLKQANLFNTASMQNMNLEYPLGYSTKQTSWFDKITTHFIATSEKLTILQQFAVFKNNLCMKTYLLILD